MGSKAALASGEFMRIQTASQQLVPFLVNVAQKMDGDKVTQVVRFEKSSMAVGLDRTRLQIKVCIALLCNVAFSFSCFDCAFKS